MSSERAGVRGEPWSVVFACSVVVVRQEESTRNSTLEGRELTV
jgi:hypothetical protein